MGKPPTFPLRLRRLSLSVHSTSLRVRGSKITDSIATQGPVCHSPSAARCWNMSLLPAASTQLKAPGALEGACTQALQQKLAKRNKMCYCLSTASTLQQFVGSVPKLLFQAPSLVA